MDAIRGEFERFYDDFGGVTIIEKTNAAVPLYPDPREIETTMDDNYLFIDSDEVMIDDDDDDNLKTKVSWDDPSCSPVIL